MESTHNKKTIVRDMFDGIAPTYDRLNHLLSLDLDRRWRRRTMRMVATEHPSTILDLATGTADLAIGMARAIPGAMVTGVDLSAEMLAVGRRKVARRGLEGHITLETGDGEKLRFADSSFDAATVGFGIRNFADIEAGLRELRRVVRPGGGVFILEFSVARGRFFAPLYGFYFHRVLPVVGRMVSHDKAAYTYLPESVDNFPDREAFLRMMRDAGLVQCSAHGLMKGIAYIYKGIKA